MPLRFVAFVVGQFVNSVGCRVDRRVTKIMAGGNE